MNYSGLSKVLFFLIIYVIYFNNLSFSQEAINNDSLCYAIWSQGIQLYNQKQYSTAIPYLHDAIHCDSLIHKEKQNRLYLHAFSYLMICYRSLDNYDSANYYEKLIKENNYPNIKQDDYTDLKYSDPPVMIGGYKTLKKHLKYPKEAKKNGYGGKVLLKAIIDEKGNVEKVEILEDMGLYSFGQAAVEALEKMKFKPALLDRNPVKCAITIPIVFSP